VLGTRYSITCAREKKRGIGERERGSEGGSESESERVQRDIVLGNRYSMTPITCLSERYVSGSHEAIPPTMRHPVRAVGLHGIAHKTCPSQAIPPALTGGIARDRT
jgi:hypothetical protein